MKSDADYNASLPDWGKHVPPGFSFCGYPVRIPGSKLWRPCGLSATPGCAYCEQHAQWPKEKPKTQPWWFSVPWLICFLMFLASMVVSLYEPVHNWLQAHTLGFWMGVIVGSVLELAIVLIARWTRNRVQWIRWFSRMG